MLHNPIAKIDNQGLSNAITDITIALIPTIKRGIATKNLTNVLILNIADSKFFQILK